MQLLSLRRTHSKGTVWSSGGLRDGVSLGKITPYFCRELLHVSEFHNKIKSWKKKLQNFTSILMDFIFQTGTRFIFLSMKCNKPFQIPPEVKRINVHLWKYEGLCLICKYSIFTESSVKLIHHHYIKCIIHEQIPVRRSSHDNWGIRKSAAYIWKSSDGNNAIKVECGF